MPRVDFEIIEQWIEPRSRVLDLGCGDGDLLARLQEHKRVTGYGVEIALDNIIASIDKGLSVIQADLNTGLQDFEDNSVDFVILSQALQAIHDPHYLLREMLRVGGEAIVSFPNIGHWLARYQLAIRGLSPQTSWLSCQSDETPSAHPYTIHGFEGLCAEEGIKIIERCALDRRGHSTWLTRYRPNLFGVTAIYRLHRGPRWPTWLPQPRPKAVSAPEDTG